MVHQPWQPTLVSPNTILVDLWCKFGYSCMWGIDITLYLALLNTIDPALPEKFVNFRFVHIFNSWYFSYSNDETKTQNLLIAKLKPKHFGDSDLYDKNSFVSLYGARGSWAQVSSPSFLFLLDFTLLFLLEFV